VVVMIDSRQTRILYVEDETTLCDLFEAVIVPRGYVVNSVHTGQAGLRI
jgi:DNA-binding response OmpR family regulator